MPSPIRSRLRHRLHRRLRLDKESLYCYFLLHYLDQQFHFLLCILEPMPAHPSRFLPTFRLPQQYHRRRLQM